MQDEQEQQSRVGQTVGEKYTLGRLLGAGGMGAVYEATNTWTGRRVALKLMHAPHAQSAELVERFLREARASSRVDHPSIVQVLDVGQDPSGALFLVQECLTGRDLRSLLDERPRISPREARTILAPVFGALAAAHAAGVVHRDLKPDNIFLAELGNGERVSKVIDFGIAKLAEAENAALTVTRTGMAIGTPLYMSPEQARGAKDVGPQTDIWALGVVLFECLSGRYPVVGESYNEVIAALLTRRPPRLDRIAMGVPKAVADVVATALEPDRSARFKSMGDFLAAMQSCADFDCDEVARAPSEPPKAEAPTMVARAHGQRVNTQVETLGGVAVTPSAPDTDAKPAALPAATSTGIELGPAPAPAPARGPGRWALAGLAVVALAAVAAVGTRAAQGTHTAAPPRVLAPPPAAPVALAPVAPVAPGEFAVALSVEPATATIELDGAVAGTGAIAQRFVRDGRPHTARFSAAGYATQALTFTDAAPATPRVSLVRTAPAHVVAVGPRVVPPVPPPRGAQTAAPAPVVAPPRGRAGQMERDYE